jgi:hypothetical protein
MDFVSDKLADGRSFRILTAVDQFTRECVGLEADRCITGMKVVPALEKGRGEREAVSVAPSKPLSEVSVHTQYQRRHSCSSESCWQTCCLSSIPRVEAGLPVAVLGTVSPFR